MGAHVGRRRLPASPAQLIADRAYTELRERIVTLRLPPGTTLREEALMAELGLGRTPLRDALKRLSLENLVVVEPRRATTVTHVDAADIIHISEVRAELEAQAAELAAMRLDEATRAEGTAILAQLEELERRLDSDALMHLDERIHRLVWRASRNPYLTATLERYFTLSLRICVRRHRPRARARRAGARPGAAAACGCSPTTARSRAGSCASTCSSSSARSWPRTAAAERPRQALRTAAARSSPSCAIASLAHLELLHLAGDRHRELVDEHDVARDLEVGEAARGRTSRTSSPSSVAPSRSRTHAHSSSP